MWKRPSKVAEPVRPGENIEQRSLRTLMYVHVPYHGKAEGRKNLIGPCMHDMGVFLFIPVNWKCSWRYIVGLENISSSTSGNAFAERP